MQTRRSFIKKSLAGAAAVAVAPALANTSSMANRPVVLATWNKLKSTEKAWDVLSAGNSVLDAVQQGVMVAEADPNDMTVGYGARPDRDGHITLDACIMDQHGNAGSVTFLQHIKHPISVARLVMEKTPHVMLSGEGALRFALENGFKKENLHTEKSLQAWEEWKKTSKYEPVINIENHDTIGLIAIDSRGNLSGACTTSGLAWKMHGRVGDSPIVGAGLFVDNEVGAACATGVGEFVMKTLGSFLVVELMRQGKTPQQAVEEAIHRIVRKYPSHKNAQVGFLALDKKGNMGAFGIQKGFSYGIYNEKGNIYHESASVYK